MAEDYMTQETNRKEIHTQSNGVVTTNYYDKNGRLIQKEVYHPAESSRITRDTEEKYYFGARIYKSVPTVMVQLQDNKEQVFIYQFDEKKEVYDGDPIAIVTHMGENSFDIMLDPAILVPDDVVKIFYDDVLKESLPLAVTKDVLKLAA